MNAQLLTTSSNAAPAKSGIGALLSTKSVGVGTKDAGAGMDASFADLLGQQAGKIDPELLEILQGLGLDPQAQKELLAQLKELGVDSDQLNKLMQQLTTSDDPKQLLAALRKAQSADINTKNKTADTFNASTKNTKEAADFINATLFIAGESKAMRAGTQPLLANVSKNALQDARFSLDNGKDSQKNNSRFDLRFDLSNDAAAVKKTAITTFNNSFQSALNAAADGTKTVSTTGTGPSSLLNELSGLNAQANQGTQASTLNNAPSFASTYSAQIATPVHQTAQWGADFGRVMVQMSQQAAQNNQAGLQTAEIRLDPPELGPLRIMLSVSEGVANAMIFAAHAQTRHALEQSLPQLQQQLAQAGLSLGEANVSDQGFFSQSDQQLNQQGKGENSDTFSLSGTDEGSESDALLGANTKQSSNPDAIIDTFA